MATLKISDLSVGDWVSYRKENTLYSIRSIYRTGVQDCVILNDDKYPDGVIAFVDRLTPIPITAEILEKNGFEEDCGRWYNSEALMEFEQYEDGWCRTINCGEYDVYSIKYVHQLQHALRLAGVDKEINL